jgi:hypothetical protein
MKRSGAVKFPNSVQLFKFCHKVLMSQRGGKVHDQDVGSILSFNPSDCSHWKRGEKNVRSVFSLAKLSETLQVEAMLVHDVASGAVGLEEAYYEWQESNNFRSVLAKASECDPKIVAATRARVEEFVAQLHAQAEFVTPPLYIPEVMRFFAFITAQPADMMDRLSRILRVKPGQYAIQYRKGDLKAPTRMGIVKDMARILFQGERARFPELGESDPRLLEYEETIFTASLLVPKAALLAEMAKLDNRKNVVAELATLFWVPKSLIGFQMADILRSGERPRVTTAASVDGTVNNSAASAST